MIPNVVRGDRMHGLIAYLIGPGRSNEHTEPHLVAGDDAVMAWHDDNELGAGSAQAIARHLDRPRTAFGVEVPRGHVWHCSLSLRQEEGQLTDEQWGAIARDFIAEMGFDDHDGTKAPCRWAAIRHGVSKRGNDHIHLAVNLVREDGTKAPVHKDYHRAQTAARALEAKYGLEPLESATAERSTRGFKPAEHARAQRAAEEAARRRHETDRTKDAPAWKDLGAAERAGLVHQQMLLQLPKTRLARTVRACAAASTEEGEFVRRMRRAGVLVRPRFADGRTDVVTGYSTALRPEAGERPVWYGGGNLGRDLTLPRLREGWPDTPQGASEAAAEWNAARRGRRVVHPGRETAEPTPAEWDRQLRDLATLRERLTQVPHTDRALWAAVARQTAGAFATWSQSSEPVPGPLAAAADALSVSAQTHARPVRPAAAGTTALAGAAMLLAAGVRGGQGAVGQAVMLRQLVRLAQAIHDAATAAGQARYAASVAATERENLRRVAARLPRPDAGNLERYGLAPAKSAATAVLDTGLAGQQERIRAGQQAPRPGSVLPGRLEPHRPPTASPQGRRERGRGMGR